jgi:hypothetical protein
MLKKTGGTRAMFKWLKKQIRQDGFGIINVFAEAEERGKCVLHLWFHYTVGNHGAGLPEILVIGGDQRMSGPLGEVAKIMRKRGSAFANGELVSLDGKYPVKLINVNCREVYDLYTCAVGRHFNTESYAVQQMMVPDREGKYPDDPRCTEPYASFRLRSGDGTVLSWPHLEGMQSH